MFSPCKSPSQHHFHLNRHLISLKHTHKHTQCLLLNTHTLTKSQNECVLYMRLQTHTLSQLMSVAMWASGWLLCLFSSTDAGSGSGDDGKITHLLLPLNQHGLVFNISLFLLSSSTEMFFIALLSYATNTCELLSPEKRKWTVAQKLWCEGALSSW